MKGRALVVATLVLAPGLPACWAAEAPSRASGSLYVDLGFEDAVVRADGNVKQGGRLFQHRINGGGRVPQLFNANGSRVVRLATSATPLTDVKDRSELVASAALAAGTFYYVGFRVYIPSSATYALPAADSWFMLTQFRQNGTTTESPSLSLDLTNAGQTLSVVARNDNPRSDDYEVLLNVDLTGKYNRWHTVVLRVNLSDAGSVKLWFDDVAIGTGYWDMKYQGATCADDYTLKFGVYRGPSATPYFVNFDNYRVASSYADAKSW